MGKRNREDVIKALECCIIRHPDDKMRCVSCPYKGPESYCLNRLKMDALELLKNAGPGEQEVIAAINQTQRPSDVTFEQFAGVIANVCAALVPLFEKE